MRLCANLVIPLISKVITVTWECAEKIEKVLGFEATVSGEESVREIVDKVEKYGYTDFSNPRYYNIERMKMLEETAEVVSTTGSISGDSQARDCP